MDYNEVSSLKHQVRCNIEALLPQVKDCYCTMEIISNSGDEQRLKFYLSHESPGFKEIRISEEAPTFQELLEICIVRARGFAGQFVPDEK